MWKSGTGWLGDAQPWPSFETLANFPDPTASQGTFALAQDTNILYAANNGAWFVVAVLQ